MLFLSMIDKKILEIATGLVDKSLSVECEEIKMNEYFPKETKPFYKM